MRETRAFIDLSSREYLHHDMVIAKYLFSRSARVPGAGGACLAPTEVERRPRRPCQKSLWVTPRAHREAILHGPGRYLFSLLNRYVAN